MKYQKPFFSGLPWKLSVAAIVFDTQKVHLIQMKQQFYYQVRFLPAKFANQ